MESAFLDGVFIRHLPGVPPSIVPNLVGDVSCWGEPVRRGLFSCASGFRENKCFSSSANPLCEPFELDMVPLGMIPFAS